jgi:hypothetical protein
MYLVFTTTNHISLNQISIYSIVFINYIKQYKCMGYHHKEALGTRLGLTVSWVIIYMHYMSLSYLTL